MSDDCDLCRLGVESLHKSAKVPGVRFLTDFEYAGGGWFRRKGVPKGQAAEMLHGSDFIKAVFFGGR